MGASQSASSPAAATPAQPFDVAVSPELVKELTKSASSPAAANNQTMAKWRVENSKEQAALDRDLNELLKGTGKALAEINHRARRIEESVAENPVLVGEVPCKDIQTRLTRALEDGIGMNAVQKIAMEYKSCMREEIVKGA